MQARPVHINTFNQDSHLAVVNKVVVLTRISIGSKDQFPEAFHRSNRNQAGMRLAIGFRCKNSKPADSKYILNVCFYRVQVAHIMNNASFANIIMLKCIFAKAFRALSAEAFREAYEINFIGSVKSIQAAEKSLKKSENASIVLFSTVAVKTGMPFHAAVASAKGAIEGLSRSLAAEFAPQVRVNTIALSLTNTKMATRFLDSESKIKASEERHPMKQIGDPNDVSVLVEFLLSENAKWITGETIRVDGGIGTLKVP